MNNRGKPTRAETAAAWRKLRARAPELARAIYAMHKRDGTPVRLA